MQRCKPTYFWLWWSLAKTTGWTKRLDSATWGKAEAWKQIRVVVELILEEFVEEKLAIPADPEGETQRTNPPSFSVWSPMSDGVLSSVAHVVK